MGIKRVLIAVLAITFAVLSCNMPSGADVQSMALTLTSVVSALTPVGMATLLPATLAPPVGTPVPPTAAIIPATACSPIVTANMNANVRRGPSTEYDAVGYLPTGTSAPVAGRNEEDSWWYIVFAAGPGGHAWIAKSVTTAACLPAVVQVVAAPPLPPTATTVVEEFAVTHMEFEVTGSCPNFHLKYWITANGPGTVTYHRVWSDGGTDTLPGTLVFSSAGTKLAGDWAVSFAVPGGSGWTDVYIDSPNHQQFGRGSYGCP